MDSFQQIFYHVSRIPQSTPVNTRSIVLIFTTSLLDFVLESKKKIIKIPGTVSQPIRYR